MRDLRGRRLGPQHALLVLRIESNARPGMLEAILAFLRDLEGVSLVDLDNLPAEVRESLTP